MDEILRLSVREYVFVHGRFQFNRISSQKKKCGRMTQQYFGDWFEVRIYGFLGPINTMVNAGKEAFGIDLILERILELSEFRKLKQLRLTNKEWNKVACRLIRKRSANIEILHPDKFAAHRELCLSLVNREIMVGVPIDARVTGWPRSVNGHKGVNFEEDVVLQETAFRCFLYMDSLLLSAVWRPNVVKLEVSNVTIEDANRLMPFLLNQLPSLEDLQFCLEKGPIVVAKFIAPTPFSTDDMYPLSRISFKDADKVYYPHPSGRGQSVLDPSFLRHCHSLKVLAFEGSASTREPTIVDLFLGFYEGWKVMVQEDPMLLHRIQQLRFDFGWIRNNNGVEIEAMIEFINFNQPTTLELLSVIDYGDLKVFSKIERWTPALDSLTIAVAHSSAKEPTVDWTLNLLKKFHIFAHLSELRLWYHPSEDQDPVLNIDQRFEGRLIHQLPNVVSMVIDVEPEFWTSSVEQAAVQIPSVIRLQVKSGKKIQWVGRDLIENIDIDFFNACKKFLGIRQLSLELMVSYDNLLLTVLNGQVEGYFNALSLLENLETLEISLKVYEYEDGLTDAYLVLVALFHGYEPHVKLNLTIQAPEKFDYLKKLPSTKLKLSVDEFKKALKDAERIFGIIIDRLKGRLIV